MKRFTLFLTLLVAASLACNASQSQPSVETQPKETATQPPVEDEAGTSSAEFDSSKLGTVEKDVTYCAVHEVELKMDVYSPFENNERFAATMFVHGGGWSSGGGGDFAGGGGGSDW